MKASEFHMACTYCCLKQLLHNDTLLWELLECEVNFLGRDKVLLVEQPSLRAEDFCERLRDVPVMMVRLGVAGPEGCAPLHNGTFGL